MGHRNIALQLLLLGMAGAGMEGIVFGRIVHGGATMMSYVLLMASAVVAFVLVRPVLEGLIGPPPWQH